MLEQYLFIHFNIKEYNLHTLPFVFTPQPIRDMGGIVTPQPLRAVRVLFSPMVSGWVGVWLGGRAAGKSLSGLYLRNRKV